MRLPTPLVLAALLGAAILPSSCQRQSAVSRVNPTKLTFEEQGVWNRFRPFIDFIGQCTSAAKQQLAAYKTHSAQKTKAGKARADTARKAYFAQLAALREWIRRCRPTLRQVRTTWPASMRKLRNAYWGVIELGNQDWDFRATAPIPRAVQTKLLQAGQRVLIADAQLARVFKKRPARGRPGSLDPGFAIEIAGVPLIFEVLKGKLNVKLSRSVGPLKFTGTAGGRSGVGRGCHTLIIESANWRRVFNLGSQSWQLPPLDNVAPIYDHKAGTLTLRTRDSRVWAQEKRTVR